jgi:enterochelin esterase-like enzyme
VDATVSLNRLDSSPAGPIDYLAYQPPAPGPLPLLLLLHGRDGSCHDWTDAFDDLDQAIGARRIPPLVAVAPDGPWSDRASFWVDSAYTGAPVGRPAATALTGHLLPHLEAALPVRRDRTGRIIAGCSMGGAGALRLGLSRPDLFATVIALSPACFAPLPPLDATARTSGAFGAGATVLDEEVYEAGNYPNRFAAWDPTVDLTLLVAVGDDEWRHPDPDRVHDLDQTARRLHDTATQTPGVTSKFRLYPGGHTWDVWRPALLDALAQLEL